MKVGGQKWRSEKWGLSELPPLILIVIALERQNYLFNHCKLVIECDRDPEENMYIRGIEVNGHSIDRAWITWEEIAAGGVITYHLSDTPDDSWVKILSPSLISRGSSLCLNYWL